MNDVKDMPQDIPQEQPEGQGEIVISEEKKAHLDKLIEEFKLTNPAKNNKKRYKGIF